MWFLYCGQFLFQEVVQNPDTILPFEEGSYRPGPLFKGPSLGIERWRFWKEELTAVPERKEADEQCKTLAAKAVDMMNALERNT
jgi:hypothetical protein